MENQTKCPECKGKGEIEQNILSGEEGMQIEIDVMVVCSECEGSNYLTTPISMTTKQKINALQTCIEIQEAIQTFEALTKSAHENVNGFCGYFPELRYKYHHNIEIYKMCITRLEERYLNLIKQIK